MGLSHKMEREINFLFEIHKDELDVLREMEETDREKRTIRANAMAARANVAAEQILLQNDKLMAEVEALKAELAEALKEVEPDA